MRYRLLLAILGILAIMLFRGDGFFPFPKSWPIQRLLFIVFIHTVALASLIVYACINLIKDQKPSKDGLFIKIQSLFMVFSPIFLFFLIAGLHVLQWKRFQQIGYKIDFKSLGGFIVLGLIPFLLYWIYKIKDKSFHPKYYILSILTGSLTLKLFPIFFFPVTSKRSDMLPIIYEAANSLIKGEAVYKYYLLDNGVITPNVRLSGMILSFIPAIYFNFDLRFINLIFEGIIFCFIIYLAGRLKQEELIKTGLIIALTCFILFPYWHFRHELYETPFWLLLFLTLLSFHKNNFFISLIFIGLMIATHQWGWLFAPYLFVYIIHNWGWKKAFWGMLVTIFIGLSVLFITIQNNILGFFKNVFGTYDTIIAGGNFYPMSMYFSTLLAQFNLETYLRLVQVLVQIIIFLFALRFGKSLIRLVGFLALSLTFMLLFNPVAWTYQYLLVVFILIIGMLFSNLKDKTSNNSTYSSS